MHSIDIIDSHTGGEPTRVVLSGFPDLDGTRLREKQRLLQHRHDRWRSAVVCEPRGSDAMVGALLLPPLCDNACASVIFFNNVGYLPMCGHAAIGVIHTLAHLGRISTGRHRLDTFVGPVDVDLHEDGRVSVHNVESYRHAANVTVDVKGRGRVCGDIVWGGNWFFITEDTPCPLETAHLRLLKLHTESIRRALDDARITGAGGATIDHVEISAPSPTAGVDARNFVLCPGLAYDRSPCGTGTSAKLACLAADGKLSVGQTWVQESIHGSVFEGCYAPSVRGVLPHITGRAHITAQSTLLIDPEDAFAWGLGST